MLSHLLSKSGIDNVVVEKRDHETIRTTHRAGILEHGSVQMLVDSGVSDRVLKDGYKHEGIDLRFGGVSHRIDFEDLVGEAVWLYPQNEVFVDLAAARERDGGEVHFSVSDTAVSRPDQRHPEDPIHRHGRQRQGNPRRDHGRRRRFRRHLQMVDPAGTSNRQFRRVPVRLVRHPGARHRRVPRN